MRVVEGVLLVVDEDDCAELPTSVVGENCGVEEEELLDDTLAPDDADRELKVELVEGIRLEDDVATDALRCVVVLEVVAVVLTDVTMLELEL